MVRYISMYYAPHILYRRTRQAAPDDEFGRPVVTGSVEQWEEVCPCRCDHSDDREISLPDGRLYRPNFHVVYEGNGNSVDAGDYVRCVSRRDGAVKAEGEVKNAPKLNYLPYGQLYI